MTYYICIPLDYADRISKTTSLLAFEAYTNRDVRPSYLAYLGYLLSVSGVGLTYLFPDRNSTKPT